MQNMTMGQFRENTKFAPDDAIIAITYDDKASPPSVMLEVWIEEKTVLVKWRTNVSKGKRQGKHETTKKRQANIWRLLAGHPHE